MRISNRLSRLGSLLQVSLLLPTIGLFPAMANTPRHPTHFDGRAAFAYTGHAVSFGERPSGSAANRRTRAWIISEINHLGGQLSLDSFTAETPAGPIPMANIVLKFPGTSGQAVVVSGHYDTKRIPNVDFVGANDGGSSTGFLIEFAHVVSRMRHRDDIYVVFFDGEEAIGQWTETNSRYGSQHLAAKWMSEGLLPPIKALINVDMIGDKKLDIADDANSSQSLRAKVWKIAKKLGDSQYFRHDLGAIDDDHKPFADVGVNAIDIIDLDYGPDNSYWHTAKDTMDKVSAHSLQVVGDVVTELVEELEEPK
ncbi:MAG: M28 family peptidase [Bryobacteraceae bacterium]